jgi:tetratricopeptide (TPR) repeat protein
MSDFEALREEGFRALRHARFDDAEASMRRALQLAATDEERELGAIYVAAVAVLRGDRNASLNAFRHGLLRRVSPRTVYAAAYYLTMFHSMHNGVEAAAKWTPVLIEAAHALDRPRDVAMAYDVAAAVESQRGNHVAALELGRAALVAADRYEGSEEALLMNATVRHNLAYNALAANEFAAAFPHALDAIRYAEQIEHPTLLRQCMVTAAIALLMRERLDEAEAMIGRVERGSHFDRYIPYVLGECARRRGDRVAAAAHFRELEAFYPGFPSFAEVLLSYNTASFLMPD